MRFLVAVKQVPDTGRMSIDADGNLVRSGSAGMLDPYCESALLSALSLRTEGDTVEVFTMGPPQASTTLRRCLEIGADAAYLISDRALAASDTWATSRALEAFLSRYGCDAALVIFGRQTIDGGTGQVPFQTARLLDVQQFAYVDSVRREGEGFVAVQSYDGLTRTAKVPLGSVVSFGGIDLRGAIPTLQGHLDAQRKEIVEVDRVKLGLGLYSVGAKGSPTRIVRTQPNAPERKNRMVMINNPATAADLLRQEMEGSR